MVENHPFEPWLPDNARLLMLGTFPPAEKRWCMPWYYPNFQNDMWRIFGIIYFQDKFHFVDVEKKTYRLDAIKEFLREKGVAIYDTAQQVIRTKIRHPTRTCRLCSPPISTACSASCPIAGRYSQPASLPRRYFQNTSASRKSLKWEVMQNSSSRAADSVCTACPPVPVPILWQWRRRLNSTARCLMKSYRRIIEYER